MSFIAAQKAAWERGEFDALQALEDTKASFEGAPITQEWNYLMGDGEAFAVSCKWIVHIRGAPLEISGIAVGRVRDGRLAEEWGAGYMEPAAEQL